jgi:hypothetical protein
MHHAFISRNIVAPLRRIFTFSLLDLSVRVLLILHQQTFSIAFLLIGSFFRAFYFFVALFTFFYLFAVLITYLRCLLLICDAYYIFVMLFTFSECFLLFFAFPGLIAEGGHGSERNIDVLFC